MSPVGVIDFVSYYCHVPVLFVGNHKDIFKALLRVQFQDFSEQFGSAHSQLGGQLLDVVCSEQHVGEQRADQLNILVVSIRRRQKQKTNSP